MVADLTARQGRSPDIVDVDALQAAARALLIEDTRRRGDRCMVDPRRLRRIAERRRAPLGGSSREAIVVAGLLGIHRAGPAVTQAMRAGGTHDRQVICVAAR